MRQSAKEGETKGESDTKKRKDHQEIGEVLA